MIKRGRTAFETVKENLARKVKKLEPPVSLGDSSQPQSKAL
jgi:hypothetical protein